MIYSGKLHPPFLEFAFYVGPGDQRLNVAALLSEVCESDLEINLLYRSNEQLLCDRVSVDALADCPAAQGGFALEVQKFPGLVEQAEVLEWEDVHFRVRTEAGVLSVPGASVASRARVGLNAYRGFCKVAEHIEALYGALCIEYSLESPAELRDDPRSLAFRNFWINHDSVSPACLNRIRALTSGAYTERVGSGTYFSTDRYYNPSGVEFATERAYECSEAVARILGRAVTPPWPT